MTKPITPFRLWLQNKWMDHKEEVADWGGQPFADDRAYFQTYKWWLKALYKKEQDDTRRKEEKRKLYG